LAGKIVIITGANTGIGYECTNVMAGLGAEKVILACRNPKLGNEAVKKLGFKNIEFMQLDLNDFKSVKAFADAFNAKYDRVDILLNNAGIMALPERQVTAQGYEKQIGVNHLGHFLLTNLLLAKIRASKEGRVVNVSSLAHFIPPGKLNFDDLMSEKSYNDWNAYMMSKLSNIYFTRQLDEELKNGKVTNVKTCSLHPGLVRTELGRNMNPTMQKIMNTLCFPGMWLLTKSPLQGAQTQLYCCLCPFSELESGSYYSDCKVKAEVLVKDWKEEAKLLWEFSIKAMKDHGIGQ
jgi:NAD(P)-dependent dehydrogenase (short-subunit alcohol dehydrogenase family)